MENSENKYSFSPEILSALIENGPDYMTELFRIGMNAAMRLERDSFLNAGPYERNSQRIGYARLQAKDLLHALRPGDVRHPPDEGDRVLSEGPREGNALGKGDGAIHGGDVCPGGVHPEGEEHHGEGRRSWGSSRTWPRAKGSWEPS